MPLLAGTLGVSMPSDTSPDRHKTLQGLYVLRLSLAQLERSVIRVGRKCPGVGAHGYQASSISAKNRAAGPRLSLGWAN